MTAEPREGRAPYPQHWDEERETLEPAERRRNIEERIAHQLRYAYENLPFYRALYDAHGVAPADVQTLEDFTARVPVVTKDMIREDQAAHPPFGSYAGVGNEDVVRIYGSSGTTGTPTLYGISKADWERAADAQAMAVWGMGVRPDDIVHFLFPFSMFIGGWAILLGATRIGATCFPAGGLESRRHLELMAQLGSTVLAGTPSYCLHLGEIAREIGLDLRGLNVHTLVVGGEPGGTLPGPQAAMRAAFGDVRIIDTGNTSECFPTQMNSSCAEGTGVHIYEDEVLLEIVDPEDAARPMPDGERGATVYTTLWRQSQPMIRFWAGDDTYLVRDPCPCGRTYPRLPEGLLGRIDDMLLIRGANVYPSAVENCLRQVPGVGREYRMIVEKRGALDEVLLEVEYAPDSVLGGGSSEGREQLGSDVAAALRATTGLRFEVAVVDPGTHEEQLFKARRVVDRRT